MTSVSVHEAQAKLPELIHTLSPGEELILTENDRPVARLVASEVSTAQQPRRPGTLRGTVLHMARDFDAPLDEFKDYQ